MIYPPLKISGAVGGEAGGRDGGAGGGDERGSDGIIPCNFKDLEWVWWVRKGEEALSLLFVFFFNLSFQNDTFLKSDKNRWNTDTLWEKYTKRNVSLHTVSDQCLLSVIQGFEYKGA